MSTKYIFIVGVPGVGKTTLTKKTLELLKKENINKKICLINFGDLIFKFAKEFYGVSDRDLIRKKLTKRQALELQELAAKEIHKLYDKYDCVIVDTHLFIESPEGFYSAFSENILKYILPDAIYIIVAPEEQIFLRRVKDKSRDRDIENLKRIKLHQELNINHAVILSHKCGCYIDIIENLDLQIDITANKLKEKIKNILLL